MMVLDVPHSGVSFGGAAREQVIRAWYYMAQFGGMVHYGCLNTLTGLSLFDVSPAQLLDDLCSQRQSLTFTVEL